MVLTESFRVSSEMQASVISITAHPQDDCLYVDQSIGDLRSQAVEMIQSISSDSLQQDMQMIDSELFSPL